MRHPAVLTVLDDDAFARLHSGSLDILARVGVEMRHDEARRLCLEAGATADGSTVRLPAHLVEQALITAPRSWLLRQRADRRPALELTPGASWFGTGPDCPYVLDLETGHRRRGQLSDVVMYADLAEKLPSIDFVMSMALPEDVDTDSVDILQFAAMLEATSKPLVASSPFGGQRLRLMHKMAAICGEAASFACLAMSSPPLMYDETALDKTLTCAELRIPLVMAPSPSAGTTAPASLSAILLVANAEILAGLVVHQLAAPGAPFVYGAGCGVTNMRTSVEAYMQPGVLLGNHIACELAARYDLPSWSYGGTSDSKLFDGQLGAEYAAASILGLLSRATLLHDVGYLESGMQSSAEALVLGDDLNGYARAFADGLDLDDTDAAQDEIIAAGPGGSHLASRFTRRNYRRFWQSALLDQARHDRWAAEGATSLEDRTRTRTRDLVSAPRAFTLDDATRAELRRATAAACAASHP